MKKLLSIFCCVFYLHSIANTSEVRISSPRASGEKVLVKALAAIVNREEKKKIPFRRANLCSSESPWL
ncbi:MAG: hypothetical protein E6H06_01285 [Bacteroidetes bacterium]|nr:MAG: hypothetical protein E6H06_01285 [Bacteroidota bacterium]